MERSITNLLEAQILPPNKFALRKCEHQIERPDVERAREPG